MDGASRIPRRPGWSFKLIAALLAVLLPGSAHAINVLVFSKVAEGAFRHDSIPAGVSALREIGAARGWTVDDTIDSGAFSAANLSKYDVVVWNNTGGPVLDAAGRAAFEGFIAKGGGYVGIHMAVAGAWATEGDWAWYAGLVGARFKHHPPGTPYASLRVADGPLTAGLPRVWRHADEWYEWEKDPSGDPGMDILLTVDESSYEGGAGHHSVAWRHEFGGGRAFYTSLGHPDACYAEADFRRLLEGGIEWASGSSRRRGAMMVSAEGLILDLDADKGLTLEEGDRVSSWRNQAAHFPARDFVKRDEGRAVSGSGRPVLRRSLAELNGHSSLSFRESELVNLDEDAFDRLVTGSGYTWIAVVAAYAQKGKVPDVHVFLGDLRNGSQYEGFWAGFDDVNTFWMGSRNGRTFGRFDPNNPRVAGPRLETNRYHVLAGRMGGGRGRVAVEAYVDGGTPVASQPFFVNPLANSSRMAIGQERDATNHPGAESFDGEIARVLIYDRPLSDAELSGTLAAVGQMYLGAGAPFLLGK